MARSLFRLATALLGCALITVGCGSSKSASSSPPTSPTTATTSASTTPAGETITGSELRSLPKVPTATGNGPSPPATATTVDRSFLQTVFNDTQRLWLQEFRAAGLSYSPARLVIFSSSVHSGCGFQEGAGPFYCGADRGIYLDVGFFDLLARQAGLGGFAQAYVIGHEFGHHIQHLLGIDARVAAANHANPAGQNALSVRVELQADCLAGVWAHSAYSRDHLTRSDVQESSRQPP